MKRFVLCISILMLTVYGLDASAQRRRPPRVPGDTRPLPGVHQTSTKLAETGLYELYEYYSNDPSKVCLHSPASAWAPLSLVLKVNADYVIAAEGAYKRLIEDEIFPAVKRRCDRVESLSIYNYIKGVKIKQRDLKEYTYDDPDFNDYEASLKGVRVKFDAQGRVTQIEEVHGWNSLAELRKERAQREKAEAGFQASLRRQEEEKQRQAEREAAARQQRLREESKGGKEPTSEDLALALARMALPSCRNLEYQKLCQASPSFYIEVKDATKLSCEPVSVGKNYVCEYRVQFQCYIPSSTGDLTVSPLHCLSFPTRTHKTGALRTASGWSVYPLDKR